MGDPNNALVALSLIGGAASVGGAYLLGRSIFNRATGIIAAIIVMFSPLAWFYSEIALPYGFMLPLIMLVTWFIYQLLFYRRYALSGAVVLGIVAGFRPDILFFLGPFWFLGTLRVDRRRMVLSWLALAVSVIGWLAPLINIEGGISAYRQVTNDQYVSGVRPASVFAGGFSALITNAKRVLQALFWMFGPAAAGLLYAAGLFLIATRRGDAEERKKVWFLLALMVPASIFFLLFLFDPLGYLLIYVAPLLLLAARGFTAAAAALDRRFPRESRVLTAGIALLVAFLMLASAVNVYLFTQGEGIQWRLPTTEPLSEVFGSYSAGGIRRADDELNAALDLASGYSSSDAAIVTSTEPFTPYVADWRRLMFYLPDYPVLMIRVDPWTGFLYGWRHTAIDSGRLAVPLPAGARRLLLLETHPAQDVSAPVIPVDSAGTGLFASDIVIPPDGTLEIGHYRFVRQSYQPGAE